MQHLSADTLDDLLLKVFPKILRSGQRVRASKGWNKELCGVVLELRNPLARLSRTETKGTVFSCLGETLWYLARSGAVIASYVNWIAPPHTHLQMIQEVHTKVGQNPGAVFDALYGSMDSVMGFGRLGKFDFLTMLGKLGVAPIEPDSAYLVGATGPLQGARLSSVRV
jgi:Alpha-glutamyl/putrescinyl thymine pyrophosphorylase clade 3